MSQAQLGGAMDLTFQQIQKYERGANRIGSSRLYQLSRVLNVPISYFFEDLPGESDTQRLSLAEDGQAEFEGEKYSKRETLELVRAYFRIHDPDIRRQVFDLIKAASAQN